MKKGERPEVFRRYSVQFRQSVVKDIESGMSVMECRRRHGVSIGSIYSWLRKYGKHEILCTKIIVMKTEEQTTEQKLRAENKVLKDALLQSQLERISAESYLEIACERLKCDVDDFKKKARTKA